MNAHRAVSLNAGSDTFRTRIVSTRLKEALAAKTPNVAQMFLLSTLQVFVIFVFVHKIVSSASGLAVLLNVRLHDRLAQPTKLVEHAAVNLADVEVAERFIVRHVCAARVEFFAQCVLQDFNNVFEVFGGIHSGFMGGWWRGRRDSERN